MLQRRPGELYTFRAGYLFTGARFIGIKEFFEEFFAGTEADELEFRAGFSGEARWRVAYRGKNDSIWRSPKCEATRFS
jgi:hypothetical protein